VSLPTTTEAELAKVGEFLESHPRLSGSFLACDDHQRRVSEAFFLLLTYGELEWGSPSGLVLERAEDLLSRVTE
jgi:hypothetical protein